MLPFMLVNSNLYCQVAEPSGELEEVKGELEKLRGEFDALIKTLKERRVLPQPPFTVSEVNIDVSEANFKGNSDVQYVLLEMSDFQCPFCARYSTQTYPQIMQNYVDTGKIQYAFMDFPLVSIHKQASKAAEVARCSADQGKFWEMHDELFARFQEITNEDWASFASAVGVDNAALNTCLDEGKYAQTVKDDMKKGAEAGVRGTPTFLLGQLSEDGKSVVGWKMGSGAQPYQIFEKELNDLIAGKEATD